MTYEEAVASLNRVRQKYPDYADMDDSTLASKLSTKFPEYSDIHAAMSGGIHAVRALAARQIPAGGVPMWQTLLKGAVTAREGGRFLVKTEQGEDGTTTYEPVQTPFVDPIQPEQLAGMRSKFQQKYDIFDQGAGNVAPLPEEAQIAAMVRQADAQQQSGVENFLKGVVGEVARLPGDAMATISPEAGRSFNEPIEAAYNVDPDRFSGTAGQVVGGIVPTAAAIASGNPALANAIFALQATASAGQMRQEIAARRAAGESITEEQELKATLIAGIAEYAGEKFGAGKLRGALKAGGTAGERVLAAGVGVAGEAGGEGFTQGMQQYGRQVFDPSQELQTGVSGAMAAGAIGGGVILGGGKVAQRFGRQENYEPSNLERRDEPSSLDRGGTVPASSVAGEISGRPDTGPETPEQEIERLTKESDEAKRILQSGTALTPEQRTVLEKTVDHNAALVMDHMMAIEDAQDAAAAATQEVGQTTQKVGQVPKRADQIPDPSADPDFKKLMGEPVSKTEILPPEQMSVEKASNKAAEIADKGVGEDVKKVLGELPRLPRVPRDARTWSFTKLKQWAKDAGYDVAQAENLRGLRKRISSQQHSSLTDLPEMPKEASSWNFRRLKYWAGKNGYSVENAESRQEVRDIVESARKADIALTRKGAPAEDKAPAIKEETAKIEKAADTTRQVLQKKTGKSFIGKIWDELAVPIGSRIREKSQRLYGRVQEMYIEGGLTSEETKRALIDPATRIRESLGGKKSQQYRKWSLHVLNGERAEATAMLPEASKADLDAFYDMFRTSLAAQKAAGMKVGDLGENYWSRRIRDFKAFDAIFGDDKGLFEEAWDRAKAVKGRRVLTAEEKMEVANSVIEGYGPRKPGSSGPGHTRERRVDKVTDAQLDFYVDPLEAAFGYADAASRATERAKFLGKDHDPEKLGDSVGKIVQEEVDAGRLKKEDQDEVRDLLHTLLVNDTITMSKAGRTLKQMIHVSSLGQIRSAINQVSDIVTTEFTHGTKATAKGTGTVLGLTTGEQKIYMEEMGFHSHGEEFKDVSRTAHVADEALRGFEIMDRFGKENRANSAFVAFSEAAKNPASSKFRDMKEKWAPVLGAESFNEIVSDLKEGKRTRRVFKLLALDVAEIQPVTPANMPAQYLKMKDGRLTYSLKSYTLNHIDFMRRDIFRDLNTSGKRLQGIKKLARFTLVLAMFNFGKDLITDLIRGKDIVADQIPERTVDSLLSVVGLNRFTGEKLATSPAKAITELGAPPLNWADALFHDVTTGGKGGLKSLKYLPIIGEPLYYRTPIGHGYQMDMKDKKARANKRIYGTN